MFVGGIRLLSLSLKVFSVYIVLGELCGWFSLVACTLLQEAPKQTAAASRTAHLSTQQNGACDEQTHHPEF